jgi:hypothetical protein
MTTYNVLIQTCNQQNLLKNNTILFFETITPTPRGTKKYNTGDTARLAP